MPDNTETTRYLHSQIYKANLSEDGYVRLALEMLLSTQLIHLLSGIDLDHPVGSQIETSCTNLSGYTEWVSTTSPQITLGWDWRLNSLLGKIIYIRLGAPRSNIMLVDNMQNDFGYTKTLTLLKSVIDKLKWQEELHKQICSRYN